MEHEWISVHRKTLASCNNLSSRTRQNFRSAQAIQVRRNGIRAFLWTLIHSCLAKAFKRTASKLDSQDAQAKVKAELESFKAMTHFPSKANNKRGQGLDALFEAKNKAAGDLNAGLEGKAHQVVDNSGTRAVMTETKKTGSFGKPQFKFVESVRKKAERENLQGATCKLCTKFYDAIIAGNAQGMAESQCNHLEKSRHRFRDLPPATPEGFRNIGFDTKF